MAKEGTADMRRRANDQVPIIDAKLVIQVVALEMTLLRDRRALKSLHQDQQCEQPRFVQGGGEQALDLREIECAVIRQQRAQLRHAYTQEHIAVAVLSWRGFEKTPRLPNDFIVGHGL